MTVLLIFTIAVALAFDFINGFHDAANSIATVVSTRVLSPRAAVAWAAFFNFIAFLVFPAHVSAAIAKGVAPEAVTQTVILATLVGAIFWNLLAGIFVLRGGYHAPTEAEQHELEEAEEREAAEEAANDAGQVEVATQK